MVDCKYCGKEIDGLSHKCKFCQQIHCSKHLLPESHDCIGLDNYKKRNLDKWRTVSNFSKPKRSKKRYRKKHRNPIKTHKKVKHYIFHKFDKLFDWLNNKNHRKYNLKRRFNYISRIILIFILSIVGVNIFYSNAWELNKINLWIINLAGVLILTSLFFSVKFGWKIIREGANLFKRQKNWLKFLVIVLFIFSFWQVYENKETVLNPFFEIHNEVNFSLFNPFDLGDFSLESDGNESPLIYDLERIFGFQPPDFLLIEQEIFKATNQERQSRGLRPLSYDDQLNVIAREHSEDMVARGFYDHENPDGEGPTERAQNKGIRITSGYWVGIAENIAIVHLGNDADCPTSNEVRLGSCFVEKWMNSPGHRQNILDVNYDDIGVGVFCNNSECYATQNFR